MKRSSMILCVMVLIAAMGNMSFPDSAFSLSIFGDQATFRAAIGTYLTEDFEDEPLIGTAYSGARATLAFDHFIASSQPDALKVLGSPLFGNHNTTPGGSKYLSADTDRGFVSADVTLEFDFPIYAFGLNIIDLEEHGFITINGVPISVPPTADMGVTYVGIIENTPFTTIQLDLGETDSHTSMDDVDYRAYEPVPEPSTMLLLGVTLIGLAGFRYKKGFGRKICERGQAFYCITDT